MRLYANKVMSIEVNQDRKTGVEPRRWLSVNTSYLPASPAANPAASVIACIPVDLDGSDRGDELGST